MRQIPTRLDGPVLIESRVHADSRGFFMETYRRSALIEFGVDDEFVQDNHSRSTLGVLRGMHFQAGQAKLVRCVRGSIYDVIIDIRRDSPSFGEWEAVELSDENGRQFYVPAGFAHGFCVTSDLADVLYKVSTYYDPSLESAIAYNDPDVAIGWPDLDLTVSERDAAAPRLAELAPSLEAHS